MSYHLAQQSRKNSAPEIEMPATPPQWLQEEGVPVQEQPESPEPEAVASEPEDNSQRNEEVSVAAAAPETSLERKVRPTYEENVRNLRESKERAERERDEALRFMQQLQSQQQKTPPNTIPDMDDDEDGLDFGDVDLVEGKHLNALKKQFKAVKQQLKGYQQQTAQNAVETRLKMEYPDFDRVVTPENIERLNLAKPRLANTIRSSPDLYDKAVAAYEAIKDYGLDKNMSHEYNDNKARAAKNLSRPRSTASISSQQGDSPLSQANSFANGFTKELQSQLYREMMDSIKNAS